MWSCIGKGLRLQPAQQAAIFKELALRQIFSSSCDVRNLCFYMSPPHLYFLSLTLRSHCQLKASHWSTLFPYLNPPQLISTHLNPSQPILTNLNPSQPISTHINLFQPISTHLNASLPISNHFNPSKTKKKMAKSPFGGGGQPSFPTLTHLNPYQLILTNLTNINPSQPVLTHLNPSHLKKLISFC